MRKKFQLFMDNEITTKEELLYSIAGYLEHCRTDGVLEEGWSQVKSEAVVKICQHFYQQVQDSALPTLHDWWYYNYSLTSAGMCLELCHCDEISYDSNGEKMEQQADQVYLLLQVNSSLLSIAQFAQHHGVTVPTVQRWLRRGRLRSAQLIEGDWRIPDLADRPGRTFMPVTYSWNEEIPELQTQFGFLKGVHQLLPL
ncbi:helix-turn-helix domain-containing protein [Anaerofilum sp. BX8]|uniref:Helix-turn-helix domain-containing protein n=1 Tax=Anaerofilum hominis TaxID=2763016 RepID=A0A923I608_9FIRM|nr:helix-turn-helix domain-containing protein [Anaerofilum hominis]